MCLRAKISSNPDDNDYKTQEKDIFGTEQRHIVDWQDCTVLSEDTTFYDEDYDSHSERTGLYHNICLRQTSNYKRTDQSRQSATCDNRLSIPVVTQFDQTGSEGMPNKYANVEELPDIILRQRDNNNNANNAKITRMPMTASGLAAFGSDEGARLYEDTGSGIYMRSALVSPVMYVSDAKVESLRAGTGENS